MKTFIKTFCITLILLLVAAPAFAQRSVTLQWDDPNTVSPTGYKIYQGPEGGSYSEIANILFGVLETTVTVEETDGKCFVATAYDTDGESEYSNQVCVDPLSPVLRIIMQ